MVVLYTEAVAAVKRWQWEQNSKNSQSNNCGPTCITFIAGFYNNTPSIGIENTRKLIAGMGPYNVNGQIVRGAPERTPTNPWQQADMLRQRGIPCEVRQIDSLKQLHDLVDNGRRPVLIGMFMGRVPGQFRDHSFVLWHAVVMLDGGWVNGDRGFEVLDVNFHPASDGFRIDPDGGRKWYPDWVIQHAYINNSPRWAVVPNEPKKILSSKYRGRGHVSKAGVSVRTSMEMSSKNVFARSRKNGYTHRMRDGVRLWANSYRYIFLGFNSSRKWAKVMLPNGRRLFIHRSDFVVDRWP